MNDQEPYKTFNPITTPIGNTRHSEPDEPRYDEEGKLITLFSDGFDLCDKMWRDRCKKQIDQLPDGSKVVIVPTNEGGWTEVDVTPYIIDVLESLLSDPTPTTKQGEVKPVCKYYPCPMVESIGCNPTKCTCYEGCYNCNHKNVSEADTPCVNCIYTLGENNNFTPIDKPSEPKPTEVDGWIRVEDRLPEQVGIYLACWETGKIDTTNFGIKDKFDGMLSRSEKFVETSFWRYGNEGECDTYIQEYPTHWRYLPQPPKE